MKKMVIFSLLVIFAATSIIYVTSCKKVKDLTTVDVTYDLPKISFQYVPATFKSTDVVLYQGMIQFNLDSILNHYGMTSGIIENIAFSNFSLTITAPPEANFDWLTSATALVSANETFEPATVVATATNPGAGSKTIIMTTNNQNIANYLHVAQFYIRVTAATTGNVPYQWINMYILGTLQMTISPI